MNAIYLTRAIINKRFQYFTRIKCQSYSFSVDNSGKSKQNKKDSEGISNKKETQNNPNFNIQPSLKEQEISQLQADQQKQYSLIQRNYNQTQVPGAQARMYSNLTELQKDIIVNSKFDLLNPSINPKTGAVNSYVGINQNLTQISLGAVKIKANDQVFLSEVDPYNIPADLNIRFDSEKELKIVGKQTKRQKDKKQDSSQTQQRNKFEMSIQPQTIQQKTIKQHMQQQFGVGIKGYKYFNMKSIRRWDILLTILSIILLMPFYSTFQELYQCYKTTSAIEEQRMKEIKQLKQRSFKRVLFENKDFNRSN